MAKLTIQDQMAVAAPFANAYATIALDIKRAADVKSAAAADNKEAGTSLWGGFQQALAVAVKDGHNAPQMRVGLAVACELAGVPSGSIRSYMGTAVGLLEAVITERLTLEEAASMPIVKAREFLKPDSDKERAALMERLRAAIKAWDNATVERLVADVEAITAKAGEEAKKAA
jgi:hypothetical protein